MYGKSKKQGRPPVNGGHTFIRFDSYRAMCFGGSLELKKEHSTYIFDLEKKVRAAESYTNTTVMSGLLKG